MENIEVVKQAAFQEGFQKQALISLIDVLQSRPLTQNPLTYAGLGAASGLLPGSEEDDLEGRDTLDRVIRGTATGAGAGFGALGGSMLGNRALASLMQNLSWTNRNALLGNDNLRTLVGSGIPMAGTALGAVLGGLLTRRLTESKSTKKRRQAKNK